MSPHNDVRAKVVVKCKAVKRRPQPKARHEGNGAFLRRRKFCSQDGSDEVKIIVIGGGLAGMATALFSSRRGHDVTVLERDRPLPEMAARPGAPHARQGHLFLGRSTQILRDEAPDVVAGIFARGALEVSPGTVLCRRPIYEAEMRRVTEGESGIAFHHGTTVSGLRTSGGKVAGIVTSARETMPADVVVNATGRRSIGRRWLSNIGLESPPAMAQKCGYFYLTRHYRLRAGESFPDTGVPLVAPLSYLTVLVFPGDSRHFQLSVAVAVNDPYRHRLREPVIFDRFLASVPLTEQWIGRGEPLEVPEPMARIENCWQRMPAIDGYVQLGDALIQTNPTMGRGVTFAFLQAQEFARTLGRGFEQWVVESLGPWFHAQLSLDEARIRQLTAGLSGEILPLPRDPASRFAAAVAVLREHDEVIRTASLRLYNMLITPREMLADRDAAKRVIRFLRAHDDIDWRPRGYPDRASFERIVGG